MRLACFVITYQRPERLREILAAYAGQTRPPDHVLVVDNGDPGPTREAIAGCRGLSVEHRPLGDNRGPAGAAAAALARLAGDGWEWMLWADDDDPPRFPDTLERLLRLAAAEDGPELGGVGAVGARFDWRRGRIVRVSDEELAGGSAVAVDVVGGGHALMLHRRAVAAAGLPDERLFFGLEEIEYCLRVRRCGLRLLVDGQRMHEHRRMAGRLEHTVRRSALPGAVRSTLWRRYYTTRNYIFLMRETFGRPDLARREAGRAVVRAAAGFLRGPRYGLAFAPLQLAAVADGYRGRMGRTVAPQPKPGRG
ncbi:MAG TPA: glycosyltransferase [Thermoanaerobaculia bacterium]